MKINNKSLDEFDVDGIQLPFTGTMDVNNNIFNPDNDYIPQLGNQKLSAQKRSLIVDFNSQEGKSNFSSEISREFILDIDDGYEYRCYLDYISSEDQEWSDRYSVTYQLFVIKRKSLVSKSVSSSISNEGNLLTGARYKITSTKALENLMVGDCSIKNMKVGTLIIDGIEKKVYYENEDKSSFDDVEMKRFPFLNVGNNTIGISDASVSLVVEYYPTYM